MGDFDSIKIGVCDAYWTPSGQANEIFLGLTKGGCELTYTPEWYDLQVDRYGNSQTDAALVGESIAVTIPLAETDMRKIEMFSHTSSKVTGSDSNSKLTFGRFPGFRLGQKAGRLRLHPVAMGRDNSEDVIIYKAVNKAPLQLNYKLDEERIFRTEFIGMIQRKHVNGAMLWEIGDSTIGNESLVLSQTLDVNGLPSNLKEMVKNSGSNIWISVPEHPIYTEDTDPDLRTTELKVYCEFNGQVYNITPLITLSLPENNGVWFNGMQVVNDNSLPSYAPNVSTQTFGSDDFATVNTNKVIVKGWESSIEPLNAYCLKGDPTFYPVSYPSSWRLLKLGDVVLIKVNAVWDTMIAEAFIHVQIA